MAFPCGELLIRFNAWPGRRRTGRISEERPARSHCRLIGIAVGAFPAR